MMITSKAAVHKFIAHEQPMPNVVSSNHCVALSDMNKILNLGHTMIV